MAKFVKVVFVTLVFAGLSAGISRAQDITAPPELSSNTPYAEPSSEVSSAMPVALAESFPPSQEQMDHVLDTPAKNIKKISSARGPAVVSRWTQNENTLQVVTRTKGTTEWRVNGKIVLEDTPPLFGLLGIPPDGKPNVLSFGKRDSDKIMTWAWTKNGIPILAHDFDKNGEADCWDFDLNNDGVYDGYFRSVPLAAGIPSPPEEIAKSNIPKN